jgi:hypothetical protein
VKGKAVKGERRSKKEVKKMNMGDVFFTEE